jgi:hypothetical protein
MSAFFVSKSDIDVIVSALIQEGIYVDVSPRPRNAKEIDPNELGRMLWTENLASVTGRYCLAHTKDADRQDEHAAYVEQIMAYDWRELCQLKPGAVAKIIACYEYQSCEHDGWHKSAAYQAITRLGQRLLRHIPGYEDAPWGVRDETDLAAIGNVRLISLRTLAVRRRR